MADAKPYDRYWTFVGIIEVVDILWCKNSTHSICTILIFTRREFIYVQWVEIEKITLEAENTFKKPVSAEKDSWAKKVVLFQINRDK